MTTGPRYNRKKDANQNPIIDALAHVAGLKLKDVSMHPRLGYDMVGRYQDGPPYCLEVKAGPSDGLTDSEKKARQYYGQYWRRVETADDVLRVFGIGAEGRAVLA